MKSPNKLVIALLMVALTVNAAFSADIESAAKDAGVILPDMPYVEPSSNVVVPFDGQGLGLPLEGNVSGEGLIFDSFPEPGETIAGGFQPALSPAVVSGAGMLAKVGSTLAPYMQSAKQSRPVQMMANNPKKTIVGSLALAAVLGYAYNYWKNKDKQEEQSNADKGKEEANESKVQDAIEQKTYWERAKDFSAQSYNAVKEFVTTHPKSVIATGVTTGAAVGSLGAFVYRNGRLPRAADVADYMTKENLQSIQNQIAGVGGSIKSQVAQAAGSMWSKVPAQTAKVIGAEVAGAATLAGSAYGLKKALTKASDEPSVQEDAQPASPEDTSVTLWQRAKDRSARAYDATTGFVGNHKKAIAVTGATVGAVGAGVGAFAYRNGRLPRTTDVTSYMTRENLQWAKDKAGENLGWAKSKAGDLISSVWNKVPAQTKKVVAAEVAGGAVALAGSAYGLKKALTKNDGVMLNQLIKQYMNNTQLINGLIEQIYARVTRETWNDKVHTMLQHEAQQIAEDVQLINGFAQSAQSTEEKIALVQERINRSSDFIAILVEINETLKELTGDVVDNEQVVSHSAPSTFQLPQVNSNIASQENDGYIIVDDEAPQYAEQELQQAIELSQRIARDFEQDQARREREEQDAALARMLQEQAKQDAQAVIDRQIADDEAYARQVLLNDQAAQAQQEQEAAQVRALKNEFDALRQQVIQLVGQLNQAAAGLNAQAKAQVKLFADECKNSHIGLMTAMSNCNNVQEAKQLVEHEKVVVDGFAAALVACQ